MTELKSTWILNGYRVDPATRMVVLAQWQIAFSDAARFPGVETTHSGMTPVAADMPADTATADDILSAVKDAMASEMPTLEFHHANELRWRFDQARASETVDLRPVEEVRAALPPLSPRQLNLMLVQIGMSWAQVQARIDALTDPDERTAANIEFNRATSFKRNHPLVLSLAAGFDFAPAEIDTMWRYAADL